MQQRTVQLRSIATFLLATLVASCESETLFKANRNSLDAGLAALDNDPANAVRAAESVVTRSNDEAGTYVLQRFFSAYLAAQAHLAAAEHGAFLQDAPNRMRSAVHLGEAAAVREPELSVGHMVAALYHASLGIEWLPAAEKKPTQEDGQALLPEAYEKLGAANAGIGLLLSEIAIYSRLRFQGQVDLYLRSPENKALLEFNSCSAIATRAALPPGLNAWLRYAIFDFLRVDNPVAAYPFAVGAIALEGEAKGAFPRNLAQKLEKFVIANDELEWVCPNCNNTSPPSLARCINCNQGATVEFKARKKAR